MQTRSSSSSDEAWINSLTLTLTLTDRYNFRLNPPAVPPLVVRHFQPEWQSEWSTASAMTYLFEHNDITKAANQRNGFTSEDLTDLCRLLAANEKKTNFARQLASSIFPIAATVGGEGDTKFTYTYTPTMVMDNTRYTKLHSIANLINHVGMHNRLVASAGLVVNLPLLFPVELRHPTTLNDLDNEHIRIGPNCMNQTASYRVTGFITGDGNVAYRSLGEGRWAGSNNNNTLSKGQSKGVVVCFVLLQKQ